MPDPARKYLDKETLARLVTEHRASGVLSDELVKALMQIAGGVWDRYRYSDDREDFVQECTLHLCNRPLLKADVQKHIFNYLTTCAIRFGWKVRDKQHGDRRRFQTYCEELVEAGRALPDAEAEEDDDEPDDDWWLLDEPPEGRG